MSNLILPNFEDLKNYKHDSFKPGQESSWEGSMENHEQFTEIEDLIAIIKEEAESDYKTANNIFNNWVITSFHPEKAENHQFFESINVKSIEKSMKYNSIDTNNKENNRQTSNHDRQNSAHHNKLSCKEIVSNNYDTNEFYQSSAFQSKDVKHNFRSGVDTFITESMIYEEIYKNVKRSGRRFEDHSFPHTLASICGFADLKDFDKYEELAKRIEWANPEQIFWGQKFSIFDQNKISTDKIIQGGLGNHYFLAAVSAIAEYPNRIKKLFTTKEVSQEGIYCIQLCINGKWENLMLDDKFPVQPITGQPVFNHCKSNEIWLMLLNKAWAKAHGGY